MKIILKVFKFLFGREKNPLSDSEEDRWWQAIK
jgi:hypothetical protein